MRTFRVVLLSWVALLSEVDARLEENLEQLEARYGKATEVRHVMPEKNENYYPWAPKQAWDAVYFVKNGYRFFFGMLNGIAEVIRIEKKGGNKPEFDREEIYLFLGKNSGGLEFFYYTTGFGLFAENYLEPGTGRRALWSKSFLTSGSLTIFTKKGFVFNNSKYFWPEQKGVCTELPKIPYLIPGKKRKSGSQPPTFWDEYELSKPAKPDYKKVTDSF